MDPYDFARIEARWQSHWLEKEVFRSPGPGDEGFDPEKPKFYALDMFPYPSGAGLHVGHPKGYTATDIVARYKRHRGFQVLHPMGWDAFGLPAEQYAVQTGTHPRETTAKNIDVFREQLQGLGFSYDWSREVDTTDPGYYRWTQWIFRTLHEKGLAYQAEVPVWWCQELGTVLANEEVIDGRSERGDHPCERRPLRQWMLRITEYADRLLEDLEGLDWPDSVKAMQREWIGRSEGARIRFALDSAEGKGDGSGVEAPGFNVFTTRPDTLFGATFCVLAPEHPLVGEVTTEEQSGEVEGYVRAAASKSELERTELQKDKTGVFTGAFAVNPVFDPGSPRRLIPIWVADYVLMSYGTGAIMCVPGGDERDHEFAVKYGLPVVQVVQPEPLARNAPHIDSGFDITHGFTDPELVAECWSGEGVATNSGFLDGLETPEAKARMISWLEEQGAGEAQVQYRLRDWLFSRQRYWGEPFPILHGEDGEVALVAEEDLPVTLPELEDYAPDPEGNPPLARAEAWVEVVDAAGRKWKRETNSMPQWAGSCWYYLRFIDPHNDEVAWDSEKEKYWMPVDLYVGGAEHAVLHLLYSRFWHKVLFDCGLVSTSEPFQKLVNQGMVQSFAYRDSRGALVATDEVEEKEGGWVRASDGEPCARFTAKMSKSLRNVVTPAEVIDTYGADAMRLYEAFMGPITASAPWNPRDIPGVHRFLERSWRLCQKKASAEADAGVEKALHAAIAKVTSDLEDLGLNTAISALMEFVNAATKVDGGLADDQALRFAILLEPFAPHLAEEIHALRGGEGELAYAPWPEADAGLLTEDTVEIPVQINGKLRARMEVPAGADADAMEALAREAVAEHLEGAEVRKAVVVPGRMVNFVVG